MNPIASLALLCGGLGLTGAALAGAVPVFDNFSSLTIDRSHWIESESVRYVDEKGRLIMGRYALGGTAGDTGVTTDSFNLSQRNAAVVKALKATITVTNTKTDEVCAANPTPSTVTARLIGSFFNIRPGGPVPNDRTGDVTAQVRVRRTSNSSDAPGVMQVQGVVAACTNADCSASTLIGTVQAMGTTTLDTAVIAQVSWDKKANKFSFLRDNQPAGEVAYTDADSASPAIIFNNVSLRNEIANCLSGPQIKGGLEARFDNVGIAP